MYNYKDIKAVHLEITERCNASCPQCARNKNGGDVNPHLAMNELTLEDCKKIFPVEFIKQLNRMYMCGNYGDPGVAQDTLEIFQYFRQHNRSMKLSMNTNGSMRKKEWWEELAKLGTYVRFSIDGLEDTNHIYRIGTDWNKIMENADAYIYAGGEAIWDYLVFAHNEHQVEEAERLSKKLGFAMFIPKKTGRFYSNAQSKTKEKHEGEDRKGNKILLEKPKNNEYHNKALSKEQTLIEKYGNLENYFDNVTIDCKVDKEKSVYISAEGIVMPCCWTANQMYVWYKEYQEGQIWNFINKIGKDNLNAKKNTLESIIDGPFFQEHIPNSWVGSSCKQDKLWVCAKTCGVEFDPFGEQFK